jgi:RNA polymerase sigma-70 factor (ECF subfamily)
MNGRTLASAVGDGEEQTETLLIEAARCGDGEAFARLVAPLRQSILRHVRWILGSGCDDDEDVAQEVLFRLHRFLPQYRGESPFRSWVYSVAGNVARTHRRRRTRERWLRFDYSNATSFVESPAAGGCFAEQYAIRQIVSGALRQLPGPLRRSVILRDIHGLDYRRIASITGVPVGTVESRIARGRERLRRQLQTVTVTVTPGEQSRP